MFKVSVLDVQCGQLNINSLLQIVVGEDELDEDALLAPDEDEDEDEESRSWRR